MKHVSRSRQSKSKQRIVSKTVKASLICRFLHSFPVKEHMIVLPSKLLQLKLTVIHVLRNLLSKQGRSRTGNSNSAENN